MADQSDQGNLKLKGLLIEGFGVEDIALKMSCAVADVRMEVEILRDSGELAKMFRNGNANET